MMNYLVRRNRSNWFDDVFDNFFQPAVFDRFSCTEMKTDIQEFDDRYELAVEMPGFADVLYQRRLFEFLARR